MARPAFLVCDTDATIQFLLAKEIRPFQVLKSYAIQPVIVPDVELELLSLRRFAGRITPDLKKAQGHGLIAVLGPTTLAPHYGGGQAGLLAAVAALQKIA